MKAVQKHQVMVVDDNHDDLRLLSQYLAELGLDVRVSVSAETALELLRQALPDLIVLDYKLPGMDGFSLCRQLKDDYRTRHIPVIFISAVCGSDEIVGGLEAGAVDFVRKPYIKAEILARIKNHLNLQQQTEVLRRSLEACRDKAWQNREGFFHRLIERVNSVYWIVSGDWQQMHYVNPAYESVWGESAERLRAEPLGWLSRLASADVRTIRQCIERAVREVPDMISLPDYRLISPDGSMKWVQTKGYRIDPENHEDDRYAWVSTDISERKSNEQNLNYLANHDPLTGLRNRLQLAERVENEIVRSERHGHSLALLIIDVDHFKSVNDCYGHMAGDLALCALAAVLKEQIRSIDSVFRYGGEEFVVILPEEPLEQALQVAGRIRQRVSEQPLQLESCDVNITVSIGVSAYPADGDSYNRLVSVADGHLLNAKRQGRNCVQPAHD
ncbi:diguanylate cyclase [Aliamphritea hakodatensis]|uniref:diguanylate cyclase n=1 Tax=Aliamphritea hakodatensis TaxID=2895352 RepID=UPI0022FDA9B2|nr:diguanylate cyclase [Aliamphritea hakodatensis]